jgi:hypothetical protein
MCVWARCAYIVDDVGDSRRKKIDLVFTYVCVCEDALLFSRTYDVSFAVVWVLTRAETRGISEATASSIRFWPDRDVCAEVRPKNFRRSTRTDSLPPPFFLHARARLFHSTPF